MGILTWKKRQMKKRKRRKKTKKIIKMSKWGKRRKKRRKRTRRKNGKKLPRLSNLQTKKRPARSDRRQLLTSRHMLRAFFFLSFQSHRSRRGLTTSCLNGTQRVKRAII